MPFDLSSLQPFSLISFSFLSPPVRGSLPLFTFFTLMILFLQLFEYIINSPFHTFSIIYVHSTGHQSLIIPSRSSLHHPEGKNQSTPHDYHHQLLYGLLFPRLLRVPLCYIMTILFIRYLIPFQESFLLIFFFIRRALH